VLEVAAGIDDLLERGQLPEQPFRGALEPVGGVLGKVGTGALRVAVAPPHPPAPRRPQPEHHQLEQRGLPGAHLPERGAAPHALAFLPGHPVDVLAAASASPDADQAVAVLGAGVVDTGGEVVAGDEGEPEPGFVAGDGLDEDVVDGDLQGVRDPGPLREHVVERGGSGRGLPQPSGGVRQILPLGELPAGDDGGALVRGDPLIPAAFRDRRGIHGQLRQQAWPHRLGFRLRLERGFLDGFGEELDRVRPHPLG
jgi:hypothetical protein